MNMPGGYGGPPPGGGFGPQGQFPPAGGGSAKMHPLAMLSAAAGVLSMPLCCCWFFSVPMQLCAFVLGFLALGKIKSNPQAHSGAFLCWIGMGCAALGFVFSMGFHLTSYGEALKHRYRHRF
jgi:hypothetical protein